MDAQILLSHATGLSRVQLYTQLERPLETKERSILRTSVQRRLKDEPIAYIISQKDWYNLDLYIDKRVLIPRPETETLCDKVSQTFKQQKTFPRFILDLCTGSGCLALALAKEFQTANVLGIDISQDAIDVAMINKTRNNVTNVEFLLGDVCRLSLFEYVAKTWGVPDLIVANPPYVSVADWHELQKNVQQFEPKLALVSEKAGLEIAQRILENLTRVDFLGSRQIFMMELANNQPKHLAEHFYSMKQNEVKDNTHQETHLKSQEKEMLDFAVLKSYVSLFQAPRDTLFAIEDLESRPRFLSYIGNRITQSVETNSE